MTAQIHNITDYCPTAELIAEAKTLPHLRPVDDNKGVPLRWIFLGTLLFWTVLIAAMWGEALWTVTIAESLKG